ncbi:MAG: hypothetical protein J5940_07265, partial [Clostridia bacterium]|nr:hypothetical protein [Clostridia bacterium]
SEDDLREIARMMLSEVRVRAEKAGFEPVFTDETIDGIVAEAKKSELGARPLRRIIQRRVEDKIALDILRRKSEEKSSPLVG